MTIQLEYLTMFVFYHLQALFNNTLYLLYNRYQKEKYNKILIQAPILIFLLIMCWLRAIFLYVKPSLSMSYKALNYLVKPNLLACSATEI